MKKFEVWAEGYVATGNYSQAIFLGEYKGDTFRDAVINYKNSVTDDNTRRCIDVDGMTFGGCRFFDNEKEARKSFG